MKDKNRRAVPSFSIQLALLWQHINCLLAASRAGVTWRRSFKSTRSRLLPRADDMFRKTGANVKTDTSQKNNILYLNVFQYISGRRAESLERKVAPLLNCLLHFPPLTAIKQMPEMLLGTSLKLMDRACVFPAQQFLASLFL